MLIIPVTEAVLHTIGDKMNPNIIAFPRNSIVVNSFPYYSIVLGQYNINILPDNGEYDENFGGSIGDLLQDRSDFDIITKKLTELKKHDQDEEDILSIVFVFILYMSIKDLFDDDTDRITIEDQEIIQVIMAFIQSQM
jgi:hypothetical protein